MGRMICLLLLAVVSGSAFAFDWREVIDVPDNYIRDVMTADLTDVECLALNIYHEARGEGVLGKQLVAQVTMNRVNHGCFPDDVCGVVRQHRQFSWTHDGKIDHPANRESYEAAYLIALSFIKLGYNIDMPRAQLLLNYHAVYVDPQWHELLPVLIHGDHIFYVRKREVGV